MLYFHYTEKLIGLQDLIVKNVAQDQNSTTIFAQMPRKPHNCPCCLEMSINVQSKFTPNF